MLRFIVSFLNDESIIACLIDDGNIIVENHGGFSSDGSLLARVMTETAMSNVGTLPDFGNFCLKKEGGARWGAPCVEEYDKYNW